MENKVNGIIIVKIGGSTLGRHDTTLEDLVRLQERGIPVIVVHGGGKIITEWLGKQSASTQFVQGERVTDKTGLEVAAAVLSGLVNKELVAAICALGGRAAGISGVDGALLQGKIRNPELGFVGDIHKVNTAILEDLLKAGYMPVVSSISLNAFAKPGSSPLLLNVNADIAAGEIAAAVKAEKLIYLTDIAGICDKAGQVLSRLSSREAEDLINSGVATSGMIPKIRSGIRALAHGGSTRIIDGRRSHALLGEIEGTGEGSTIYKGD
ncbi:MAG: acetylglutamate kinase [Dehalococcoidales bacterium]|nr:acetylglutamate kinase [Dehalococcoidales bacterium]